MAIIAAPAGTMRPDTKLIIGSDGHYPERPELLAVGQGDRTRGTISEALMAPAVLVELGLEAFQQLRRFTIVRVVAASAECARSAAAARPRDLPRGAWVSHTQPVPSQRLHLTVM
jgi:hypothetical protein